MRRREQEGYIFKRNGVWVLRYRITMNKGGELVTVQKARVLAPVDANHKTKASVRDLAKDVLAEVNEYRSDPLTVVTIGDFVKDVYLPFIKAQKRPSTHKGYRDMWDDHLRARCGDALLRDVRTCDVQHWLEAIAAEDRTKTGEKLSRPTLKHIRSLLSGIFSHAKRQGYLDALNPVQNTAIPAAPEGGETHDYSLEEVTRMLIHLPEPAATIVATAAYTGASRSELRGMRWEDYHDGAIYISRAVWQSYVTGTKTKKREAPIPVIPRLVPILEAHRLRCGNPASGPIFAATNGNPIDLNNVLYRTIQPALNRCAVCRKPRNEHTEESHEFRRDDSLPQWHGWHAFRRGLASILNRLGIDDEVIQRILRHSKVETTQNHYIKTAAPDAIAAMQQFNDAVLLSCSECAQNDASSKKALMN